LVQPILRQRSRSPKRYKAAFFLLFKFENIANSEVPQFSSIRGRLWRASASALNWARMRADINEPDAEKKAAAAFYPRRLDEDDLKPQEAWAPELSKIAAQAGEKHRKAEHWHTFKTP